MAFTDQRCRLQIRWLTITGPRCRLLITSNLQIRGYQLLIREKIKMLKTDPKKVPSQNLFLLLSLGTMT